MEKPETTSSSSRRPSSETKLEDVAGFSDMIELPRPPGGTQGAIAIDFDGDGFLDLLLIGTGGLRLLRNNQKGNFDDVTEKWGLTDDPGCLTCRRSPTTTARAGRRCFTSLGKLYTNLGDKFRDDTALLPETPSACEQPGRGVRLDRRQRRRPAGHCQHRRRARA